MAFDRPVIPSPLPLPLLSPLPSLPSPSLILSSFLHPTSGPRPGPLTPRPTHSTGFIPHHLLSDGDVGDSVPTGDFDPRRPVAGGGGGAGGVSILVLPGGEGGGLRDVGDMLYGVVVVVVVLEMALFFWATDALAMVLGGVRALALAWGHWPPFGLLTSAWGGKPPGFLGASFPDHLRRPDLLRGTLSSMWWGGAGPCQRSMPPSPPPGSMWWWRRAPYRVGPLLRRLHWLLLLWATLAFDLVSVLGGSSSFFGTGDTFLIDGGSDSALSETLGASHLY